MFVFSNMGQKLVDTSYWASEHALMGFVYISVNAGAARLLLPRVQESHLPDIGSANEVVISFASRFDPRKDPSIEIMFDDGSANPFCLFISRDQCDCWASLSAAKSIPFSVVTQGNGEVFACEAKVRKVRRIPCLLPWNASHANSVRR
ncbi:hypothetical protein [Methylosinus sp. PW1]|uniref:hypothetical protein n=1 Tax=Methylosinus sp. PW1 TaxID=107636 RepID=UPI001AEBAD28|nr:hypothetical protein [Methylosinus sp. PW1]